MTFVAVEAAVADNLATRRVESRAAEDQSSPQPSEDCVNLSLVAIEKEGLVKLAAAGSITAANFAPDGKNPLERILGQNWASFRVMLDMKQTSYIDSSAIGWLIGSHKSFKQAGGAMILHDVPTSIRQMLDLLHVGKVVPIAATAQAARELAIAAPAAGGQP
jgi:anti-anti-sigma factor